MKCSAECRYYDGWINNSGKLILYCKRRGLDIDLITPKSILEDCDKFKKSSKILYDFLKERD